MFTGPGTRAGRGKSNKVAGKMLAHTIKANITGSAAAPVDSSLSAILDAEIGSTRGTVAVRGASAWLARTPSTAGTAVVFDGTDTDFGSVGGMAGGGLVYVGGTVLSGAATTLTVSGLDLTTHGRYFCYAALKNATGSNSTLSFYYNSDTTATNYDRQGNTFNGGTITGSRANDAVVVLLNATTGITNFQCWISNTLDGKPMMNFISGRDATTTILDQLYVHEWRTASNVTSITLSATVANSIASGSYLQVWRLSAS